MATLKKKQGIAFNRPVIRSFHPKCELCGRFIALKDFEDDKVKTTFIPDTHFTVEKTIYRHRKCMAKENCG